MAIGQEWIFWAAAAAIGLFVALILAKALLRKDVVQTPAAAYDLQVYRDQLSEIDRDLARGVIGAPEADRLRTEVSRRVIEADRNLHTATRDANGPALGPATVTAALLLVLAAAFGGYWMLGAPGYPDMPMKSRIAFAEELRLTRPSQAAAEANAQAAPLPPEADAKFLELMDKLRTAVAARPDDLQGLELLARNEARIGRFADAHAVQARIVALKGENSTAEDYAALAELLILSASGYVSPEAEIALTEALRRDPKHGTARYYSGLMMAQTGRPDLAFRLWQGLLESSAPTDPWVPPLRGQIEEMAALAGVQYTLPPEGGALPGPTGADMAAAADMSDTDRQAMIEGMVGQLSTRLAASGGTPEEWARLIGAYGVLGKTEDARAAWVQAQAAYATTPDDLALIRAAADQAGVAN
ncbi:MAG: c-type cytochrome biogenesis protein CcmI [Paracoccaceae bacterium]